MEIDVIIYATRIEPFQNDLEKAIGLLDIKRKEKVLASNNPSKMSGSIYAGLLLRYAFKCDNSFPQLENLNILFGENGKPYFENEDIFFSISHSNEYCILAIGREEMGIDIEKIKENNEKIAHRFFLEEEKKLTDKFYDIWCTKEACSKLNGDGVVIGFKRYQYKSPGEAYDLDKATKIYLKEYQLDKDYKIICAKRIDNFAKNIVLVNKDELLK